MGKGKVVIVRSDADDGRSGCKTEVGREGLEMLIRKDAYGI